MFYNKLQEYINNKIDLTIELIKKYDELIDNNDLKDIILDTSEKNIVIQLKIAVGLIGIKNAYGITNERYLKNISKFCKGFEINKDVKIEDLVSDYKIAFEKYYTPYINSHSYIFENYFVNYVFRTIFPYNDEAKDVLEKYIILVIHYVIFKIFLIGISAYGKELNDNLLIDSIYSFEREIEHNSDYLDMVVKILEVNNFNTLSHMVMLSKE